jgi:hypothetical protein
MASNRVQSIVIANAFSWIAVNHFLYCSINCFLARELVDLENRPTGHAAVSDAPFLLIRANGRFDGSTTGQGGFGGG